MWIPALDCDRHIPARAADDCPWIRSEYALPDSAALEKNHGAVNEIRHFGSIPERPLRLACSTQFNFMTERAMMCSYAHQRNVWDLSVNLK